MPFCALNQRLWLPEPGAHSKQLSQVGMVQLSQLQHKAGKTRETTNDHTHPLSWPSTLTKKGETKRTYIRRDPGEMAVGVSACLQVL